MICIATEREDENRTRIPFIFAGSRESVDSQLERVRLSGDILDKQEHEQPNCIAVVGSVLLSASESVRLDEKRKRLTDPQAMSTVVESLRVAGNDEQLLPGQQALVDQTIQN